MNGTRTLEIFLQILVTGSAPSANPVVTKFRPLIPFGCPAGTLSGAPKIRACQLIGELENNKRGIYGGAIGYIDFAGNMDTCIAIRIAYKKNGKVFVRSGAGIVADSVPEKEYEECLNKARASLRALEEAVTI